MLDAAGEDVGLQRAELVRDTVHEGLHPLEDDAELLVGMAMERHRGARFEADEVQHRLGAEQRPTGYTRSELEGANLVEAYELRLHTPIIVRLRDCGGGRCSRFVAQRQ